MPFLRCLKYFWKDVREARGKVGLRALPEIWFPHYDLWHIQIMSHRYMSLPKSCFRIAKITAAHHAQHAAEGQPRGGLLEVTCVRRPGPHCGRHLDLFASCPGRRAETHRRRKFCNHSWEIQQGRPGTLCQYTQEGRPVCSPGRRPSWRLLTRSLGFQPSQLALEPTIAPRASRSAKNRGERNPAVRLSPRHWRSLHWTQSASKQ